MFPTGNLSISNISEIEAEYYNLYVQNAKKLCP